ncbi:hypothetical protein DFS34DRAFT_243321 [Phlyctochytrium arcticum]|nr:hypothetical protein DFS34DRAFT_243321 [Phlyctochytrium arcticum]
MSTYNTIEPTVVDEDLLRKAVNEQVSVEVADIARREGIDPADVTSLRLDYKNVLKIDNLWMFENLTKLQLDNNIIEKIENINFLKNLQWLDLSFNNISKIEGLDGLTKLTDLTLYNNRISSIGNLDDLVNLNVLSLGNNGITVLDNVNYLAKFNHLRVLNLSGNTICRNANYRNYILAHIRGLRYLDYRLVEEDAVAAAKQQYIDDIIAQEEEDKIVAARMEDDRRQREQAVLFESAHIPGIDVLFGNLFSEDPEFQRFASIITPEPFGDLRDEYQAKFDVVVNELRHFALKRAAEKKEELDSFTRCVAETKAKTDQESWNRCKRFSGSKKRLLLQVQQSNNPHEIADCFRTLRNESRNLSDTLLSQEMTLVEQFEDVLKEFERNYTEMSSSINETGATSFARLRELENEFHERLSEAVIAAVDRFIKGDLNQDKDKDGMDLPDVEDDLRDIMNDKDALMNAINSSHDFRLGKFDHQEDVLATGVAKDLEKVIQAAHDRELARDRDRVCEIIAFLDRCNSEIELAEENVS